MSSLSRHRQSLAQHERPGEHPGCAGWILIAVTSGCGLTKTSERKGRFLPKGAHEKGPRDVPGALVWIV